ncbi:ribonuclease N [Pseudonocardiaceae bacterium YIM PH 21723]|nr:ribonuclease N [Pseudonocardiaceae bacterium YIM PH 21723]
MSSRRRITYALVGLVALVVAGWLYKDNPGVSSLGSPPSVSTSVSVSVPPSNGPLPGSDSGLQVRKLAELPKEAANTWAAIRKGPPYKYGRDGIVFENREKRLPKQRGGYYHEFTVETPGSSDRGARRLITGEKSELYFTQDHYASFVVVDTRGTG